MIPETARLALKPMIEYSWEEGQTLFFKQPGRALAINDPSKFIFDVCRLLTGNNTASQINEKLQKTHPEAVNHLSKLLGTLNNHHLLEDKSAPNNIPKHLQTNAEFFNAHLPISTPKERMLTKLGNKKITVLGLGGIGSNVTVQLMAMGCKNITVIDHDTVSLQNLNRQISYSAKHFGTAKTDAFQNFLNYRGLPNKLNFINTKITKPGQITPIITDSDLVICAIDEPREHILDWVNHACIETNTPMVCGGVDYTCLTYFSIIPHVSGCLSCWQSLAKRSKHLFKELNQQDNFVAGQNTNVAIMPYIAMVTGLISNEAIKLLTDYAPPLAAGKLWLFDCMTNKMVIHEEWQKQAECSICD